VDRSGLFTLQSVGSSSVGFERLIGDLATVGEVRSGVLEYVFLDLAKPEPIWKARSLIWEATV